VADKRINEPILPVIQDLRVAEFFSLAGAGDLEVVFLFFLNII
jgi:hypothetical protein